MNNLINKFSIGDQYIYKFGYIFYGLSVLLILGVMLLSINFKYFVSNKDSSNISINSQNKEDSLIELKEPNFNSIQQLKITTGKNNLSTKDLSKIFEKHAYLIDSVRKIKQVPDITIDKFPDDFNEINSTKVKKSLFIKSLLPLIIRENNKILDTRNRIIKIQTSSVNYTKRSEALWLKKQYVNYKVKNHNITDLLLRVDTVPVSIALAQAAIESGWGTSRFVIEGNALFGQWSWNKGSGIVPIERDIEETYEIKAFESLSGSVASYMKNLNTNKNYLNFRKFRNEFKSNGDTLDSLRLLKFLTKYAQNENYSNILEKIIVKNKLKDFDEVKIYIAPYEVATLNVTQQ
ncbi:glucosaminidase domain-containing protein [bacterium]|nr:glucosaminidase domain-containing protein [Pelagibacteraceae bacterium]MDC3130833.1 glucosaminidase domain-containing protein [bacterium]